MEKGENVSHFIFINEFSEKAKYYNIPTIRHIQKEIEVIKTRTVFSIIEDCKQFLVNISEEIMEENPKMENLITIEGKNSDKILSFAFAEVLKNLWENLNIKFYSPEYFKKVISDMNPMFKGVAANDSKDLILFMLENIHKELNT